MRVKKFACCLMVMSPLAGISLISCDNSSRVKVESEAAQTGEDPKSSPGEFTSSVALQHTRVRFPLKAPVTLSADDGETEKTLPFTKEKRSLLDSETLKEERITQEEGGVYVSEFTLNEPAHKALKAEYEEPGIGLRVEFELLPDGKWYVVGCYTGWYGYDLPITELKQTIQHVQEENTTFKEFHP